MLQIVARSVTDSVATPSPVNSQNGARAAAHTVSAQQFQDHVLGLHPVGQSSRQRDLDDARRTELVAVAGHRDSDVEATGAGREHPNGTGHRRV
jgi:hypothetical protein